METLWPYGGFAVRAFERKLGEGKLTLTEQSLLFEAKNGETIGFDLPTLRLIRLKDVHTVEVAYSIQGELRNASLRIVCTFTDGTEREELPPDDDPYRMSLFGRSLEEWWLDFSQIIVMRGSRPDKMTDEEFEARIKDLERNISLFRQEAVLTTDVLWDEELRKRSLEEAESGASDLGRPR